MPARHLLVLLLLMLTLTAPAHADLIHYKDGRTLEGRIIERTSTELVVETAFGTIRVPLSKVERIEEKATPEEELATRRAEIADDDAAALFELALWARDAGLTRSYRELLQEVVDAHPEHTLANELLGRVFLDGRWFEPDQLAAYVAEHADEKRRQGLIFHEGRWQKEAVVMKARGLVLHGDEWVPRRQGETAMAVEDLARLVGIEVSASASEHITLFSALEPDEAEALLLALERQVVRFLELLEPNDAQRERLLSYDVPIVLLPDQEAMRRLHDTGFVDRFGIAASTKERFRGRTNFALFWPRPLIVLVSTGEHVELTGELDEVIQGLTSHQLCRVLLDRMLGGKQVPPWFDVGLAALLEGETNYFSTVSMTRQPVDDDGLPADPFILGWEDYYSWQQRLSNEAYQVQIPPLRTILRQAPDQFDSREIGVCWSRVRFLLEQHADELRAYLAAYASDPLVEDRHPSVLHEEAWLAAFAETLEDVEDDWRQWVLAQGPALEGGRLWR
jgi:hypothetical protein